MRRRRLRESRDSQQESAKKGGGNERTSSATNRVNNDIERPLVQSVDSSQGLISDHVRRSRIPADRLTLVN